MTYSTVMFDHRWIGAHGIGRFASEVTRRIPALQPLPIAGSPSGALDPLRLTKALHRARPSLFFSPGYNCPVWAPCPLVVTVHDLAHIQLEDHSRTKRAYYRWIIRPALRRAAAVLTVSEYFRSEIALWAGIDIDRIFNVGNGVSARFQPEGSRADVGGPYFLHVGNQRPHKNLSRCLSAFAASGLAATHRMICTGQSNALLVDDVHRLSLEGRVAFVGKVSDEGLAALYRGATALIFASLYEGFGIPIIEAMACGTPVITSTVTSMPEIAGDAALLVDPRNQSEIAAAMVLVAGSTELQRRLGQNGRERMQLFSWERTAGRVASVLEAVIQGHDMAKLQKSLNASEAPQGGRP